MIRSAEVMHLVARRAAEFGVEIEGSIKFNLAKAVARKDAIVQGILDGIYGALERRREVITFVHGEARFLNDHEIDTGEGSLSFKKAIIATGARNVVPPIKGIGEIDYLTNRTALLLDELPASIVIIGGGYIGLEFAQMYSRFGTEVTLLAEANRAPSGDQATCHTDPRCPLSRVSSGSSSVFHAWIRPFRLPDSNRVPYKLVEVISNLSYNHSQNRLFRPC